MSLDDLLPLRAVPTTSQLTARAINNALRTSTKRSSINFVGKRDRHLLRYNRRYAKQHSARSVSELSAADEAILGTVLKLIRVAMGRFASGTTAAAERTIPANLLALYGKKRLEALMLLEAKKYFASAWRKSVIVTVNDRVVTLEVLISKEPQIKNERRVDARGKPYTSQYVDTY